MFTAIGLLVPFLGTLLGATMVFFVKKHLSAQLNKLLLGFASGVMIAASVWSLLIPSLNMSSSAGRWSWLPAAVGFLLGMGFLLLLDTIIPHLHINSDEPEGMQSGLKKTTKMVLAVTLHNIPEGMAVGVVLAGALSSTDVNLSSALALSIGIAIQNFPEGAIVSLPLKSEGMTCAKAFGLGAFSGVVEPVFGLITICLISVITPILPYLLAFAAGAMIYVVVEELIPESQHGAHSNVATIGVAFGFVLMMILDVALG